MKVKISIGDIVAMPADAILVSCFEGNKNLDGALADIDKTLNGAVKKLIEQGEIKGKSCEVTIIHTLDKMPARIVAVMGLGKESDITLDKIRQYIAQACRLLRKMNCQRILTTLHGVGCTGVDVEKSAQAISEGCLLGLYSYRKHFTKEPEYKEVSDVTLVDKDNSNRKLMEQGSNRGNIVATAANFARDLVNEPANYMTPTDLANVAGRVAKDFGLGITIMDRDQMKELGMGALLGVAQGSEQPPKMIVLSYRGNPNSSSILGLIGKGLTFDSGGISLKPSEGMHEMKGDMSGGAAVMAALSAIAQLKPEINVTAIIPATENLPSGKAVKPGDILKALNGKTIEVINTDAEGRLILADALSYAVKQGIAPLIDIATLTGACHIALGDQCSGIFANDQGWVNKVVKAGENVGERLWQMPMYEEYKELNKSDVADLKNSGGRYGGAITAAQFLSEFVDGKPWAHIDIAGTFFADKEHGYMVKGATGVCVRAFVDLALSMAKS
jgi:leucyl aminopeptidase